MPYLWRWLWLSLSLAGNAHASTQRQREGSLNTGGVSGGLRSVRPWLAVFLPAGRCIELGSAVHPLALSLAVRSLAGCTADLAADDRSVSACLCAMWVVGGAIKRSIVVTCKWGR